MGKDLKGKELGVGLSQRKDGRYSARFVCFSGKRRERYFDNVKEAKLWLMNARVNDERVDGEFITVDEWFNIWIENYKEGIVADNTTKNYRDRYNSSIKKVLGNKKLSEVRNLDCQKLLNDMYDDARYSTGTMELTQITMHAIFKGAVQNHYIKRNPADNLIIKRRNLDEERRVLTLPEQKIFTEYCKNSMYSNAYLLVLCTGLRAGEVGGLKWEDIDFEKKLLYVNRTVLQEKAKGGFYFGEPKTRLSKRTIPLTNDAIQILENQKKLQARLKSKCKDWVMKWDGLVFTTINGNPVGSSTFRTMLVRIVNNINNDIKAGLLEHTAPFEHIYMHALRHTFATRCIEAGIQPKVLQTLLGHSTIGVTMDLYVHVTDDHRFDEIEKLEGFLNLA